VECPQEDRERAVLVTGADFSRWVESQLEPDTTDWLSDLYEWRGVPVAEDDPWEPGSSERAISDIVRSEPVVGAVGNLSAAP